MEPPKSAFDRPAEVEDVFVGILRIADVFTRGLTEILEPFRLTPNQYRVLQALRHTSADGLTCGEVGERLTARDPDITRLLDRLELLGLVARRRERPDRRVVRTQITDAGAGVLASVDRMVGELQARYLEGLGAHKLSVLSALLNATGRPPGHASWQAE
jgi:DNA-binding MarR family transcriptional regulator